MNVLKICFLFVILFIKFKMIYSDDNVNYGNVNDIDEDVSNFIP